jgi:hypothetical protein
MIFFSASCAGGWKGGLGGVTTGTWQGVGRTGAVPLATQGYPTTQVGREWKQRFEGAVEFQRDYDQSRAVQTRHCSYCRFSYVRPVFLYSLINHIQFSSVQFRDRAALLFVLLLRRDDGASKLPVWCKATGMHQRFFVGTGCGIVSL